LAIDFAFAVSILNAKALGAIKNMIVEL